MENTDHVEIILSGTKELPYLFLRGIDNDKIIGMAPLIKEAIELNGKKDLFGNDFS